MVKALFDTCILIDHLRGKGEAREEIDRYQERAISIVTWMEVMVGASADVERGTRAFLDEFVLIDVDSVVAERAVEIRRTQRIKTARCHHSSFCGNQRYVAHHPKHQGLPGRT